MLPNNVTVLRAQAEAAIAEADAQDTHRKEVARFAYRLAQALPDRPDVPRSVAEHLLAAVAALAAPEVAPHE